MSELTPEQREAKNRRNWWNKILGIFFVLPTVFNITFGIFLLVITKVFGEKPDMATFIGSAFFAVFVAGVAYGEFLRVMKDEN